VRRALTTAVALAAVVAVAGPAAAATTTTVTERSTGWSTADTKNGGAVRFTTTHGAPAGLGTGALELSTPDGTAKAQYATAVGARPLAEFASLSYWTYRDDASTASAVQVAAVNLTVDYNGPAVGGFATLIYEPTYSFPDAVVEDVWQQWPAGQGTWWSSKDIPGVATAFTTYLPFSALVEALPEATVSDVRLNQGSGNSGLVSAVDGLTVGDTVYDFEPYVPTKEDCKDGGWRTNFADEQFRNQGQCVSSFAPAGSKALSRK
jgi:hypothetical protein